MFEHTRITLLNVQANLAVSTELLVTLFASSMKSSLFHWWEKGTRNLVSYPA